MTDYSYVLDLTDDDEDMAEADGWETDSTQDLTSDVVGATEKALSRVLEGV